MLAHRFKTLMGMVRRREFRRIWKSAAAFVPQRIYSLSASRRDRRYGGISVNKRIPSRYPEQGAYATQSSDYRCLKRVFCAVPLRPDDVFVDVGCGEGRVLTYLHEKGFRGRAIGIELDEAVAKTAMQRTSACPNATVVCGNVLEQGDLLKDATAVYLFNPFSRSVMHALVGLLESVCIHPVRVYYLNCLYAGELEEDGRWICLSKGEIRRRGCRPMRFTVHELHMPVQ